MTVKSRPIVYDLRSILFRYGTIAILIVGIGSSIMYHYERQHWISTVAEIYRVHALNLVKNQFSKLQNSIFSISRSYEFRRIDQYTEEGKVLNKIIDDYGVDISAVIIRDRFGNVIFGDALLGETVVDSLIPLHQKIDTSPYLAHRDTGLDFIEGRVFLYSSEVVVTEDSHVLHVTLLKEVTNKVLMSISQNLGQKLSLDYTSASSRIMQISYADGYELQIGKITHGNGKMKVHYDVKFETGRVQPANLAVEVAVEGYKVFNPLFFLAVILISLILISWRAWRTIWSDLVKPTFRKLDFVTDINTHNGTNTESIDRDSLPRELKNLYDGFENMYSSMAEQNNFSNLLVDAIGDVIITIDNNGYIRYLNPAAEHWLGFSESKVKGQLVELYINNLDERTSSVQQWIYQSNVLQNRTQCRTVLSSLGKPERAYVVDVICQPLVFSLNKEYQSTTVLVLRIKERIEQNPYDARFAASDYTNH